MRKLRNPYAEDPNYNCFGCSPNNKTGLKMTFYDEGEYITAEWEPTKDFQGFYNVLHGGIQATMLDEIACWAVSIQIGTSGVTTNLNIKYRNPVLISEGNIKLRAKVVRKERRIATIHTELITADGKIGSEAEVQYMVFPEDIAKKKLDWPGVEAFY